jgi:hypothetical protein
MPAVSNERIADAGLVKAAGQPRSLQPKTGHESSRPSPVTPLLPDTLGYAEPRRGVAGLVHVVRDRSTP